MFTALVEVVTVLLFGCIWLFTFLIGHPCSIIILPALMLVVLIAILLIIYIIMPLADKWL
jgi:hypothetical protein